MRAFRLPILWALFGTAAASYNLTAIVSETPSCALTCLLDILPSANCTLLNLAPCLCTNVPLQANISACVLSTCNFTEQAETSLASQEMCAGYPKESRSRQSLTIELTFFGFTTFFLFLRVLSRQLVAKQLFSDDYAAIAAYFFVVASVVLDITFRGNGFGQHIWDVNPNEEEPILKVWYVAQIIYTQTQTWGRISLLLLYLRLFPSRGFRRFCLFCIAFIACHSTSFTLTILFQCTPIQSFWDLSIPGKCISTRALAYAGAGLTIFEDIVFLGMPLTQLKNLQVSKVQKMSLMGLFGVGIFATLTSVVRLTFLSKFSHSIDITWDNVSVLVWSTVETDVMLICSCLPAVRPLYIRFVPQLYRFTERTITGPVGSYIDRIWPPTVQPTVGNSWVELNDKEGQNAADEKNLPMSENDFMTRPAKQISYSKQSLSKSTKSAKENTSVLVTQVHDLEDEIYDLKRNLEPEDSSDEEMEIGLKRESIMREIPPANSRNRSEYLTQEATELRARIQELQGEIRQLKAVAEGDRRRRRTLG